MTLASRHNVCSGFYKGPVLEMGSASSKMRVFLIAVALALLPVTLAAPAPPGTESLSDDIVAAGAPLVQAFSELGM